MRKEVRVLLFRKLSRPASQSQQEVSDAAVAEMMDQIFGCGLGPVILCDEGTPGASKDTENMVNRILERLFSSIYSLEAKKELHVTITHAPLSGETDNCLGHFNGCPGNPSSNDHFVAAPEEVHAYMLKIMPKCNQDRHIVFTVHVRQSRKCCGILHLLLLRKRTRSSSLGLPLDTLVNILQALESSPKTHMEYHNIQLTRILKQLMGDSERTVIINYPFASHCPDLTSEDWRSRYRNERLKYSCLKNKVLGLTLEKEELAEYFESLESSDSSEDQPEDNNMKQEDQEKELKILKMVESKNNYQLQCELEEIGSAASQSIMQLQQLHLNIGQLAEEHNILEHQLNRKNRELATISAELWHTREELKEQKLFFKEKLLEYSNMFHSLWRQQISDIQQQELQQRKQLSDTFDAICQELQAAHERKIAENPSEEPGGNS